MNYRTFAATAGMVAALAVASQALAQAAPARTAPPAAQPAAAAAPPISFGPAIPGVCVLDLGKLAGTSLAGKAMFARLKVLEDQAKAEVSAQGKTLQADYTALQQQQGTLDQNAFESRAAALQVRKNGLERLAQQRGAELERTAQVAQDMLLKAADPSVRAVFQTQHCAILFDRTAVHAVNPAMDITDAVVVNLNGRVQTLNFDRANLTAPRQ